MIRTLFCKHEDSNGELQDIKVEYEVVFPTISTDENPFNIKIVSVTCDDLPYPLDEESQEELIDVCCEDFDDDNWEYEND